MLNMPLYSLQFPQTMLSLIPCIFLRICDNLINLLILQLRRGDAIEKKQVFNGVLDRCKYKHISGYEKFLNETLQIPFNWYTCKESKKLKWRDLTGPEKLRPSKSHAFCVRHMHLDIFSRSHAEKIFLTHFENVLNKP